MYRITKPIRALLTVAALAIALPSVASAQEAPKEVPPEVKRKRMKKLMAVIKREPSIKEVHRFATEHYELETDRINGMATRAHVKALVPEIEAGLDNMVGNNFQNTRDGLFPNFGDNNNPNNFKERVAGGNDQTTWRVRAV